MTVSELPKQHKMKRITGEAYWRIHDLMKEGEKKVEEYGVWARKECRRLKLLPDVTDFLQGVVWSEPERPGDLTQHRVQVQNIEDEKVIAEALRLNAEVTEINRKIAAIVKHVAMAAGVRMDQVNAKTGMIKMDPETPDIEDIKIDLPALE